MLIFTNSKMLKLDFAAQKSPMIAGTINYCYDLLNYVEFFKKSRLTANDSGSFLTENYIKLLNKFHTFLRCSLAGTNG